MEKGMVLILKDFLSKETKTRVLGLECETNPRVLVLECEV